MSKEFKDRLARGELTDSEDYQRMQDALHEMKKGDSVEDAPAEDNQSSQEWQSWDLSPVWSPTDQHRKPADESIRADSVQRALDRLDRN